MPKTPQLAKQDDTIASDLRLPTDYPLKEAFAIYARRLGVLLTGSTMIFGVGAISLWFSLLLAPLLYFASPRFRAILRKRLKDTLLASAVVVLGLLLDWLIGGGVTSIAIYLLLLMAVIAIFKRK